MLIRIELKPDDIKRLIINHVKNLAIGRGIPHDEFVESEVKIFVMSKQNYREKEWEHGDIRVLIERDTDRLGKWYTYM